MQRNNKEGILGRIVRIENTIKIRPCTFSKNDRKSDINKLIAEYAGNIDDYKSLKESVDNINIDIQYRKLAFQPVKVHNKRY